MYDIRKNLLHIHIIALHSVYIGGKKLNKATDISILSKFIQKAGGNHGPILY